MEKQTLEALQGSIRKWDRIMSGESKDRGVLNCPLCMSFHKRDINWDLTCDGCPVQEFTGWPGCVDTPYIGYGSSVMDGWAKGQAHARRERDFLISLLPAGVGPALTEEKKSDNSSPLPNAAGDPLQGSVRSGGAG